MASSQNSSKNFPVSSSFFSELKDPRRTSLGNHLYPLDEILFLSIAAVISGRRHLDFHQPLFGKAKLDCSENFSLSKTAFPPTMCWEKFLQLLILVNSVNVLFPG